MGTDPTFPVFADEDVRDALNQLAARVDYHLPERTVDPREISLVGRVSALEIRASTARRDLDGIMSTEQPVAEPTRLRLQTFFKDLETDYAELEAEELPYVLTGFTERILAQFETGDDKLIALALVFGVPAFALVLCLVAVTEMLR